MAKNPDAFLKEQLKTIERRTKKYLKGWKKKCARGAKAQTRLKIGWPKTNLRAAQRASYRRCMKTVLESISAQRLLRHAL